MNKRISSLFIALCVVFSLFSSVTLTASAASGGTVNNITWSLDDSGTLTLSGSGTLAEMPAEWSSLKTDVKELVIESGVEGISGNVFQDFTALESVTIPASLRTLEGHVFNGCVNLKRVYASSLSSWCTIDFIDESSNPLYYAGKLYINGELASDIVIPEGTEYISNWAFDHCADITSVTVPKSVEYIGKFAFSGCSSLADITLPDSLSKIGFDAFFETAYYNDASNWEDGLLYIGNKLIAADYDMFGDCTVKDGTAVIADYAFNMCFMLTSINLPGSITHIGDYAFAWCYGLTDMIFPENVVSIGDYVFYDCTELSSVTLHDKLEYIGDFAFGDCVNLSDARYIGSESSWNEIQIGTGNEPLTESICFTPIVSLTQNDDGTFSLTLDLPEAAVTPEATVYAAGITADGELAGLSTAPAAEAAEMTLRADNAASVRVFVWNKNMQPLISAKTIDIK